MNKARKAALAATKSSANPKDSVAALKVSFDVCPQIAHIYWALAMMDGDVKYGIVNWREKKVLASVYTNAIRRHLLAFCAGEDLDVDPVSGAVVPHLGRIMACCSIIADAQANGNLIDDRRTGDRSNDLMKALTHQDYNANTLKLTRTPGPTLDETRGGPIDFGSFMTRMAEGQRSLAAFRKAKEQAQKAS
jgi:hypothetical protein